MAIYEVLFDDGPFCSQIGGGQRGWYSRIEGTKKVLLPKTCLTYPTMLAIGTVIPYPKKIQKIYKSLDTDLTIEFC